MVVNKIVTIPNPIVDPKQAIIPNPIHAIPTANPTHGISPRHNANPSIAKNPNTTIGTVRHGTMTRMRQIRMR